MYSWGLNQHGQLGTGSESVQSWPAQVRLLRNQRVRHLAAGTRHSAALTQEGGVFTFGCGAQYQLGHGGSGNEQLPRQVVELMGVAVRQLACGKICTLALTAERPARLFQFGLNDRAPSQLTGPWNPTNYVSANKRARDFAKTQNTNSTSSRRTEPCCVIQRLFAGEESCSVTVMNEAEDFQTADQRFWTPLEESVRKTPTASSSCALNGNILLLVHRCL